jgi:ribosomal protein S18 acetylase RimI-like enzyme
MKLIRRMEFMCMSQYALRRVQPVLEEAAAVLSVEHQSLGDSSYTPEEALRVLQRPEHQAYLALKGEQPVGFLSCLETPTCHALRLEIDMLGVRAEDRGRGIATDLIRMAMDEADGRGTHLFRGVVAQNNLASQGAFRRAGLRATAAPALLWVYEILGREAVVFLPAGWTWHIEERQPRLHLAASLEVHRLLNERGELVARAVCLQVQTLSYRGFWIEELSAGTEAMGIVLRAIVERAKILDLDQVGHLATGEDARDHLHIWLRQGYRNLGPYFVFSAG